MPTLKIQACTISLHGPSTNLHKVDTASDAHDAADSGAFSHTVRRYLGYIGFGVL